MPDAPTRRTVHQRHVRARSWQVTLILTLFFISVAGAAGIGWWYARESPPHQGPMVLIAVDGLNAAAFDAPKAAAAESASTASESALTALARDAVIFDRAYIHSPELLPAHVSLLTGQLPYEHGVRDDAGFAMRADTLTLPALLRNRGFSTGAAVSSFLLRETTGVGRGFSTYVEAEAPEAKPSDLGVLLAEPATDIAATDGVRSERAIEAAATWAAAQHNHRYFLMLEVDAAHAEAAVDRIVSLLREHHLYDGSTIVLVGDRGKVDGTLDEETLRVPLLVKQPQREGAGRHIDKAIVQHIDVLPTILDLVRAPLPSGLRGRSLKPLLTEASGQIAPQPVYSESLAAAYRFGGQPSFALTLNDYRYVRSDSDDLVRIAGAPEPATPLAADVETAATTSGELPLLKATLVRMLKDRSLPRAAAVAPRDRSRLAAAGVLPGLQTVENSAGLTPEQQDAIIATHRDAARLLASGRLAQALRTLEPLAKMYPELAAVHYQIGSIANELGRTAEAITELQQAADRRPDAPEVGRALALALMKAGRFTEAEAQINMTIDAAAPMGAAEVAAAHDAAVRIALAMKDPDAALKHAESVQNAAPSIPMRAFVQGQLLATTGDSEEASRVLRGAAAMLRQHDIALEGVQLALGRTLASLMQPVEAEAAFRAELKDFPRSVAAYSGLVELLHDVDRDEDAAEVIAGLLTGAPTPEGYSAAARLWTLLGENARAAEVRSDARARFPWEPSPSRFARVKPR